MFEELIHKFHNLDELVRWAGYFGITLIVFCETGVLAGFFLPGDSLLVMAGLVASQGHLNFFVLNLLLAAAAIVGDSTGYMIGHYAGPKIFRKEESLLFHKDHLIRTQKFFERHGGKTIILARFVPIIRTFAPTVAGAGKMNYRYFLTYNVVGGLLWVLGMTSIGYFMGKTVPHIEKNIHLVTAAVIALSFLPILFEWLRARSEGNKKS